MRSRAALLRSARSRELLGLVLALAIMVGPGCSQQDGVLNLCQAADLFSVHFVNASTGWVVGAKKTICKKSGSAGWSQQVPPSSLPPTLDFYDVQFVDDHTGWVVGGAGTILNTTTAGNTWTPQISGVTYSLRAVYFVDASTGWAVGDAETVLKTMDGGLHWLRQNPSPFGSLSDIYCINSTRCLLVGASGGGSTPIKWTSDGGATWWAADVGFPLASLSGVYFASPLRGFAVGYGGLSIAQLIMALAGRMKSPAQPKTYTVYTA